MQTIIISLIKNKSGDTSNVNNYRPIARVTVASKIFEIILLEMLTPYFNATDNQFGFKKGHSTDHCIFALKMFTQYYKSNNSPVYSCFLDASKSISQSQPLDAFYKIACCTYTYSVVLVQNPNILCQMGFYNIRVF